MNLLNVQQENCGSRCVTVVLLEPSSDPRRHPTVTGSLQEVWLQSLCQASCHLCYMS